MKAYIEKILLPYVREKRKELKLAADYPAMVIFDKFTGQGTDNLLSFSKITTSILSWSLPTALTDYNLWTSASTNLPKVFYDSNFRSGMPVRSVSNLVKRKGCLQLIYD